MGFIQNRSYFFVKYSLLSSFLSYFCQQKRKNGGIMSHLPTLISDLALILVCAGLMTLLFKKLKQPLVLGYVVAGFLASPHMPYTPSVMGGVYHYLLYDSVRDGRGVGFRLEADGLSVSGRYDCHVVHDYHL